jgi:hypothetical protein
MPEPYVSLDGRRQAVTIVFAGIALVSVAAVIVDVLDLAILDRLIAGEDVTDAQLSADDTRMSLAGLLQFAAYIAGAVVFIRWLHRAYLNVDSVAPQERRYGHGWAIGGWFVPILALWRPKQVINDVWRAGGSDGPGALLWFWWAVFLVSGWAGNIALRSLLHDDTPEELRSGTIAYMVSDGLDIAGAILAVFVVRAASDRLDGRAAAAAAPPPAPAGGGWEAPERPTGAPA